MRAVGLVILMLGLVGSGGCSVVMAVAGEEHIDASFLRVGISRGKVESYLGKAVKIVRDKSGQKLYIFEYILGNEPSFERASLHLVADMLTLGLWEIIGTKIEDGTGEIVRLAINYDDNQLVNSFKILP